MSFNRSNSDIRAYKDTVRQSTGPGKYQMYKTPVLDQTCFPKGPSIRLQKNGVSVSKRNNLTDIHSNLLGISVNKEPMVFGNNMCSKGYPCSGGLVAQCLDKTKFENNKPFGKECFIPVESTRLSNPPCTLRGLENNLIENIFCINPLQTTTILPFRNNMSVRLYEKDTFTPCVYTPNINIQTNSLVDTSNEQSIEKSTEQIKNKSVEKTIEETK